MRKKHKRENKALKLLIWIAAAAGVTVVALFALLTSREQQQEHKNADKRQQAEPLVIEVPEQETEGSIRVFDYDGCNGYSCKEPYQRAYDYAMSKVAAGCMVVKIE